MGIYRFRTALYSISQSNTKPTRIRTFAPLPLFPQAGDILMLVFHHHIPEPFTIRGVVECQQ